MSESQFCEGCPTNPPCAFCPNAKKVVAPPAERVKRVRVPFNPDTMGFGRHAWEYIDPSALDIEAATSSTGGRVSRDFNCAFNMPNEETDVNLDTLSRIGAVIETTAEGNEGTWEVVEVPSRVNGVIYGNVMNTKTGLVRQISAYSLGIVADREQNTFLSYVVTRLLEGGKANRESRERLTKLES